MPSKAPMVTTPVPPMPAITMLQGRARPGSAGSGSAAKAPASVPTGRRLRSAPPSTVTKLGQKPSTQE